MAILELQNAITLMKNLTNGLKVKLEPAEERVKELEDRWAEIIQSKILGKNWKQMHRDKRPARH